jgi:hypothetical protein
MSVTVYKGWKCPHPECGALGIIGGESYGGEKWAECLACGRNTSWELMQKYQQRLQAMARIAERNSKPEPEPALD